MSLRNWLSNTPLGVGVAIILLLTLSGLQDHYQNPAGPDSGTKQQDQNAPQRGSEAVALVAPQAPEPNPKPDRDEWRAERDSQAQVDMAKWALLEAIAAIVGVGITGAGVLYVKWTLDVNREATKAAIIAAEAARDSVKVDRDIGEAQVRAYLSCVGAEYAVTKNWLQCQPIIKNTGQSPARFIRLSGQVLVYLEKTHRSELAGGHCEAIPAQGQSRGFILWTHVEIGTEVHDMLRNLERQFSVVCRMTWMDVFDREQVTTFLLDPDIGKGAMVGRADTDGAITGTLTAFNRSGDWNSEP